MRNRLYRKGGERERGMIAGVRYDDAAGARWKLPVCCRGSRQELAGACRRKGTERGSPASGERVEEQRPAATFGFISTQIGRKVEYRRARVCTFLLPFRVFFLPFSGRDLFSLRPSAFQDGLFAQRDVKKVSKLPERIEQDRLCLRILHSTSLANNFIIKVFFSLFLERLYFL